MITLLRGSSSSSLTLGNNYNLLTMVRVDGYAPSISSSQGKRITIFLHPFYVQ